MEITVHRCGANYGPFSLEEATDLLRIGSLRHDDWAWINGGEAWTPLAQAMGWTRPTPTADAAAQKRQATKAKTSEEVKAADKKAVSKGGFWERVMARWDGRQVAALAAGLALVAGLLWWWMGEEVTDYNTLVPRKGVHYVPGEKKPFTGLAETHYFDGSRMIAVRFKDGREHGPQRSWYNNGNKETEGTRVQGKWDGKLTHWYPNGQKMAEYTYDKGKLLKRRNWDEFGAELDLLQAAR